MASRRLAPDTEPSWRAILDADRRIGQQLFSWLTRALLGRRFYDTTSGLKALRPGACRALVGANFVDFHTEAIVRLELLGYRILEHPIEVREREAANLN